MAMCSLLLLVVLLNSCSAHNHGSRTHQKHMPSSSSMYKADVISGRQPPACTDAACKPVSAAPKCCSRGHGTSSSGGSSKSAGRFSVPHGGRGGRSSPAPLKRQRYDRYTGAADADARDQQLPGGCLMRQSLYDWQLVATLMCPSTNPKHLDSSHSDGETQVHLVFNLLNNWLSVDQAIILLTTVIVNPAPGWQQCAACFVQVAFYQTYVGAVPPPMRAAPKRSRAAGSGSAESGASNAAAMPAPQLPPKPERAAGHGSRRTRRPRRRLDKSMLPPEHVLRAAWQQIAKGAEAPKEAVTAANDEFEFELHWEPHPAGQSCQQDAERCQPAANADAAAADSDHAADEQPAHCGDSDQSEGDDGESEDLEWHFHEEQLVQCSAEDGDSSEDDGGFCMFGGDEEEEFDELEGLSVHGLAFLALAVGLGICSYVWRKVSDLAYTGTCLLCTDHYTQHSTPAPVCCA